MTCSTLFIVCFDPLQLFEARLSPHFIYCTLPCSRKDLRLRSRPATVGSRKNWMIAFAVAAAAAAVASLDAAAAGSGAAARWRRCRWRRPSMRRWPPPLRRRRLRPRQRQRRRQRLPPTDGSWNYLSTAPSSGRTWVCYSRALGITVRQDDRNTN